MQDAQVMMQYLQALLAKLDGGNKSVRLLGVSLSNLVFKDRTGQSEKVATPSLWDMERFP